jgi:allantoinase
MTTFDLIVRNGEVVTGRGIDRNDIAVRDGVIREVGLNITGSTRSEVDASKLYVFPGGIDPHVHFQDPGHTEWEGFATGSQALAAGGMTLVFDMPLDSVPVTIDGESFDRKLAAIQGASLVDFALWGGLVPGNLDHVEELAARGVVGFKAFMANGTDDFPAVDDATLYEGMRRCADLGCLVAVHAENEQLTIGLAAAAIAAGRSGPRDFIASRPIVAENEAISRALMFAEDTKCALHIVHVTTAGGVALVAAAQARGVDVSCETCPHYLVLNDDDIEPLGVLGKCAPPLRPAVEINQLWERLRDGSLGIVASDHSPCATGGEAGANFFASMGGISGCQTTRQLLLEHGHARRGISLPTIAAATATNAARRFHIPAKGDIAPGFDADLALIDISAHGILAAADLFYRHKRSPYVGQAIRGQIVRTYVRGTLVFAGGKIVSPPIGRLVTPQGMHARRQ